ncbi:unnamed protein product [Clonostachys rosea]|uniref:Non-homologous end-joining factor 1 n=1 Tax=Bionectria ochroleuca TaxID=29856 RepID=A0ABY6TUF5_BIOOC|nr:unnamed protein product [Clonostachys rosea]
MGSGAAWRPLPLPSEAELPALLVSFQVEAASYTVRVTDMANMWIESLDRKAICMRGWGENTSIDPSDTPENMAKFLSSIHSALDPSLSGHDQTSMTLSQGDMSDTGEGGLTLRITCDLPGLPALKWPVHLKKAPSSSITSNLVLPLIQAHYLRQRELDSLANLLHQKDQVITKLLDKLEAVGTGLEHIFNPLSGKKKVSRAVAEDKVKGLAPFNRSQWGKELWESEGVPRDTSEMTSKVFDKDSIKIDAALTVEDSPKLDMWWRDFQDTVAISQSTKLQGREEKEVTPPPSKQDDDDDDFQVQATPPHLTPSKGKKNAQPADDASTDSAEDAPVSKRNQNNTSIPPSKPQGATRRLGAIGSKKLSPPKASSKKPAPVAADDDETASEDGDATASEVSASPPPPSPTKTAPVKGKLGRIGAAKANPPPQAATSREQSPEKKEPAMTSRSRPNKIGMIGKITKSDDQSESAADDGAARGRKSGKAEPTETKPPARETSAERADRRREELKRELEKKAAAGPTKKKRRF